MGKMKRLLKAGTALATTFSKREDGATALSFALGLTVMLGAIGAGMDISVANKGKSMAQHVADSVALNAAAYMRDNEEPPKTDSEGFINGKVYDAKQLGYDFGGLVPGQVDVKVEYDMANEEAITTVSGNTQTTFTTFLGFDKFEFASSATVKFKSDQIQQPVSIAVVADSSGSMWFEDTPVQYDNDGDPIPKFDNKQRFEGLRASLKKFRNSLRDVGGSQGSSKKGKRSVRMGLLAYSDSIINSQSRSMRWGYLNNGKINGLTPTSGTDSAPPMTEAEGWMANEDSEHESETGRKPLKYVVFMTDGVNTTKTWVPDDEDGTLWRRQCTASNCYNNGYSGTDRHGIQYYQYERATVQSWGYSDAQMRSFGYELGDYEVLGDSLTLASCTRLKNQGVRVFTIGFALESGHYFRTDDFWDGRYDDRDDISHYEWQGADRSARAYALLQGCASNPEDFSIATNSASLDQAFQNIGLKIKKEVIRLSN